MFDLLFEGSPYIYVPLVALLLVLLFLWWQNRRRHWLYISAGIVILAGVYFLLDQAVETDREEIERKLGEMAEAVQKGDVSGIFKHISSRFQLGTCDRAAFRGLVEDTIRRGEIEVVEYWDPEIPEDRPDPEAPPDIPSMKIFFRVKPKGPGIPQEYSFFCRARFVRDADDQWRLQSFQVSDPVGDSHIPLPVCGS